MATDPFLAEIRIYGCTYAPMGWAQCNGQLVSISQNTALFSLLGTQYGGDGKVTFGLPGLQANTVVGQGQGPGLTPRFNGEIGGEKSVTLGMTEMPAHNHSMMGKTAGGQEDPVGHVFGIAGTQLPPPNFYTNAIGTQQSMNAGALPISGGNQPHNNLMPYQVLNYCIAMQGVYPPRG